MYELVNDTGKRTIRLRMSGSIQADEMRALVAESKKMINHYRGGKLLLLADMRGFKAAAGPAVELLAEAIAYGRQRGVVGCVHLTDSAITRLQASRLAREASPGNDLTVEAASPEEAEKALTALYEKHFSTD